MGARQKLNGASLLGSFLFAGVVGWLTGSPGVFFLVVVSFVAGDIRPPKSGS